MFQNSNLAGVNLRVANLRGSCLKNSSLKGACLAGADLEVLLERPPSISLTGYNNKLSHTGYNLLCIG